MLTIGEGGKLEAIFIKMRVEYLGMGMLKE